ncbi:MAG: hypothetical protein OXI22_04770, partial [Defluviicoccus sp.]|nr:hypothetical protein [Defluviicoccus sp.]
MTRPVETTVDDIARLIGDGSLLALPKPEAGAAMAAVRALIRRGAKRLRLWCLPASGLQVDLLVGAGCVASVECSGVSLGEFGAGAPPPPRRGGAAAPPRAPGPPPPPGPPPAAPPAPPPRRSRAPPAAAPPPP